MTVFDWPLALIDIVRVCVCVGDMDTAVVGDHVALAASRVRECVADRDTEFSVEGEPRLELFVPLIERLSVVTITVAVIRNVGVGVGGGVMVRLCVGVSVLGGVGVGGTVSVFVSVLVTKIVPVYD